MQRPPNKLSPIFLPRGDEKRAVVLELISAMGRASWPWREAIEWLDGASPTLDLDDFCLALAHAKDLLAAEAARESGKQPPPALTDEELHEQINQEWLALGEDVTWENHCDPHGRKFCAECAHDDAEYAAMVRRVRMGLE